MEGIIWSSVPLMASIDLLIAGAALFLTFTLLGHRHEVRKLDLMRPLAQMTAGTIAIAAFHLIDLGTMTLLPAWLGEDRSLAIMTALHLEWHWLVTLFAVGAFSVGLWQLLRTLIPRLVSSQHSAADAKAKLLQSNFRLEEKVAARTRELEDDVRKRERIEQALRHSETRYRSLFDASPVALWEEDWSAVKCLVDQWQAHAGSDFGAYLDAHPDLLAQAASKILILDVNHSAMSLYGAAKKKPFIEGMHRRLVESPFEQLRDRLVGFAAGRARVVSEIEELREDGKHFVVRATLDIPATHENVWARVLVSMENVTEFRELSSKLSHQASHDALTGLINRREFDERMRRVLETARNEASEHALCYLDLDQFKLVNDACGHHAGDELLRQVAGLLARRCAGATPSHGSAATSLACSWNTAPWSRRSA
jgi:PAS domain-containing protein